MKETLTEQVIRLAKSARIEGYNIDNPEYVYTLTQYQLEQFVLAAKNDAILEIQNKINSLLKRSVLK